MKVVLYARVSSERQVEKDLSISAQLKALRKHASDHGWEIYKEFVDEAESARSVNRPAFKEMIALARRKHHPFEAILVWKLSRFARNREDSILYKSLLRKHGVSVISINEQIDDTPSGKLLEGMIEVIDEFYSTNLAQDTIRGMKENASRGYHNGGTVSIGYKANKIVDNGTKRTKLEIDETFAPVVRRIFRMCFEDRMGAKEITKVLNREGVRTNTGKLWFKNKVYYILKNEVYTGTLVWNLKNKQNGNTRENGASEVVRLENNHPAIVEQEVFDNVQKLLEERSPKNTPPRTVGSRYLLSGMLRCDLCGGTMIGIPAKSGRYHYYSCQTCFRQGKDACEGVSIPTWKLEKILVERLKYNVLTEENLVELVGIVNEEMAKAKDSHSEHLGAMDSQIEALRGRLHRLYDALETGSLEISDLAPRIKDLKSQIDGLEFQKADLEESMDRDIPRLTRRQIAAQVRDLHALLSKGSIIEQRSFLRTFVKKVQVRHNRIAIDYTIPLRPDGEEPHTSEVLTFAQSGSPGWCLRA